MPESSSVHRTVGPPDRQAPLIGSNGCSFSVSTRACRAVAMAWCASTGAIWRRRPEVS